MKLKYVYICPFVDWEIYDIKKVFTKKKSAIKYCKENNLEKKHIAKWRVDA